MQSYDYSQRKGVEEISWERFAQLTKTLAEKLAEAGIEVIVGIARAGLFPATAVACALRCELYPVRVTRRENDRVTFEHPVWKIDVSPEISGKVIAVVDEIADTGETLALVAKRARELGATRVVTASLISHTWAKPMPEIVALVTDAFVIFPWDKYIYRDGQWQLHPELTEALNLQRKTLKINFANG
ncbi:phosphoribosyltransferase [candidate division KSB1 bacterium]|nr:phosphoribosyltransferase [candidate division KSB1 bacterium]